MGNVTIFGNPWLICIKQWVGPQSPRNKLAEKEKKNQVYLKGKDWKVQIPRLSPVTFSKLWDKQQLHHDYLYPGLGVCGDDSAISLHFD